MATVAEDYVKFWATYGVTKLGLWAVQNPMDAAAYSMALSHPVSRRILVKVATHMTKQAIKDITFYSTLVYDEAFKPMLPSLKTITTVGRVGGVTLGVAVLGYSLSQSPRINYEYLVQPENISGSNGEVYAPMYFLDGFA
jgi:hypothetical protein